MIHSSNSSGSAVSRGLGVLKVEEEEAWSTECTHVLAFLPNGTRRKTHFVIRKNLLSGRPGSKIKVEEVTVGTVWISEWAIFDDYNDVKRTIRRLIEHKIGRI